MANNEVFEINDFSTSSDWERFVADLEEILTEWNLISSSLAALSDKQSPNTPDTPPISTRAVLPKHSTNKSYFNDQQYLWTQKNENLKFGKVSFMLSYFVFKPIGDSVVGLTKSPVRKTNSGEKSSTKPNRSWTDMQSVENDWAASGHPLVRYYGLGQFLLLTPLNSETISTEDRIRHLLGSASIALHNIECEIPFFCQICQPNRRLFAGVQQTANGFRTFFDMIQFAQVPGSFQFVSELIVLFKKKLYSSFSYSSTLRGDKSGSSEDYNDNNLQSRSLSQGKIQLSIRFTFLLSKWPPQYLLFTNSTSNHPVLDQFSYFNSNLSDPRDLIRKPINQPVNSTTADPIKQLQLATTWPSVAEELIVDNAYHSDLQPRNAPRWSLRALFALDGSSNNSCQTVQFLRNFLRLKSKALLCTYLAHADSNTDNEKEDSEDVRSALDRLTSSSVPGFVSTSNLSATTGQLLGQMMQNIQISIGSQMNQSNSGHNPNDIIQFIFDTSSSSSDSSAKTANFESIFDDEELKEDIDFNNENKSLRKCLQSLKSSPVDSLSWRISLLIANVFHRTQQLSSVASVWKAFVDQLRVHWQNGQKLPALGHGPVVGESSGQQQLLQGNSIDYGNCLFHQKLQMLDCCIRQKIKREQLMDISNSELVEKTVGNDSPTTTTTEEDEFFDCDDELTTDEETEELETKEPEGRLEKFEDKSRGEVQYLLERPAEPIYIPVTQDPAPMTEDVLIKQMSTLAHINASAQEDSSSDVDLLVKQKAHFQSAGLLSDMEAFKAANPGATFEDFIRWHSPRDWIELDEDSHGDGSHKKFGLSRRMAESNCSTWHELWSSARPCPVHRQKRLFNYTKEAEEILHSFEMISIESLISQMTPIVTKSVFGQILQYRHEILLLALKTEVQSQNSTRKFREILPLDFALVESMFVRSEFESICDQLAQVEHQSLRFYSLLKKLCLAYESEYKKPFKIFYRNTGNRDAAKTVKPASRLGARSKLSTVSTAVDLSCLIEFITGLLLEPEMEFANTDPMTELVVRLFADADRFRYEQSTSIGDRLPISGLPSEDNPGTSPEDDQDEPFGNIRPKPVHHYQLPPPTGKEFIFRAPAIARPAPYSRPSFHRMYCLLSPGKDFRIASAFSEDTAYF